jgi:hypothetical protein
VSTASKLESYGSPELALLLAASRGDPTREAVRRLMARRLDWAYLTTLAVESHATPGLWEVVSAFPDLPPEADTLQSLAVVNGFRLYHIRKLVARVVRELREEGIELLALKGAALLVGGVSRPPNRTMSDIDMLVVKGSAERAWKICREKGWPLVDDAWTEELYRDHHHLPPLLDPDGVTIVLELHRTLLLGADRLGFDVDEVVARARTVDVDGIPVLVPSVEDLLLHACLHFGWSNKLRRGAWRAYADAHAIIGDPHFSWDRFVPLATSRRARQSCYWTLRLGTIVADLAVPDEVLRRLDPSSGGRFAALLERHFVSQIANPAADSVVAERAQRWLWFAAMQEQSTSEAARKLWSQGSLEMPGETGAARRGALRAAISTGAYIARLAARG